MAVLVVLRVGTGYLFSVGSTFFFCSAKLAGIRQSGENAAPAAAGGPATAEPAKGSAVQAKPQPDKKAAA